MNTSANVTFVDSAQDAELVATFFNQVWGGAEDVAPMDIILAAVHVGGYAAAVKHDESVVAASFGFPGHYAGLRVLHSHVTASTISGLGYALKLHQKEWAETQGYDAITWTFDPLVRRNCVFNFEKLGAVAVEYLENFYGTMQDSINRGEDSDRLFLLWPISSAAHAVTGAKPASVAVIDIPDDIEQLRIDNSVEAAEHRVRVRGDLSRAMRLGARIRAMNPERTALLLEEPPQE